MTIVFVSNYLTHHQIAFCNAMQKLTDDNFTFVAMEQMEEERVNMGWSFEDKYSYNLNTYENEENYKKAKKLVNEADVVIYGGNSYTSFLRERIEENRLTFLYSERIYKKGLWRAISPRGFYYIHRDHSRYKKKNVYLLAASAYAAFDFALQGAYKKKAYKWGYFPYSNKTSEEDIFAKKDSKCIEILWVARFLQLKHPELVIKLAERLKKNGYNFHITMVGDGERITKIKNMTAEKGLAQNISFIGSIPAGDVREYMERANIFLFTSDYNEGWGTVVNEAMNSGCAVVASHAAGAVPFLIQQNKNGLIFKSKSINSLYKNVKYLMDNKDVVEQMGRQAYKSLVNIWSPEKAAENLYDLCEKLLDGKDENISFGPCSKAKIIRQSQMYKRAINNKLD